MSFKKKIKKFKEYSINSLIYNTYYHRKIDEKLVYVESRDGKDFTGNILRIVEELSTGKYGDFKIVVYGREGVASKIKQLQKNYSLKIDKIIEKESIATMTLEKAKYIITDSGLRPKFVKRPGQVVIDTWHGTPLKTMGIYNEPEEHRCANIQQVFFACDYLLYPNYYMKEKMLDSYMMDKLYPGKILMGGYPRNSIFFYPEKGTELKEKLGFADKQVYAYMPTFKGLLLELKDNEEHDELYEYLKDIDSKLTDDQILLVKLHVFYQEKLNFKEFNHVKPFPSGYEIYDILNMTDCLITDYSSVFFDYANSKKKIILFNYDEEEYMKDRGTFFPLSDLPFPKVQTVEDLMDELNSPKNYDDEEFIKEFCTYDNADATEKFCKQIFNGEDVCKCETIQNDKKNILIFAGGLARNGITSSLLNVLDSIDRTQYNIFICYRSWDNSIKKDHSKIFKTIPDNIKFAPLRTDFNPTITEKNKYMKFLANKDEDVKIPKQVKNLFEREYRKSYSDFPFDSIIHFNGYGTEQALILNESESKKSIWVHNDMLQEMKTRSNQQISVLRNLYKSYDNVCVVSPDLIKPTSKINKNKDNIKLVHNINNYHLIEENASKELTFDNNTIMTTSNPGGIKGVLESPGKKFITIGRFSPEKQHARLIRAFNKFCEDYPDTQLIIIGGHGFKYNSTKKQVEKSKFGHNITIIKSVFNPMPILKECDLFILPSLYEGWPMVIMEADTLNVPIIATDIVGTQWMRDYGGNIVDDSEEGILQGMYDYMEGNVNPKLNIDYEEYNKKAVEEFLKII